MSAQYSFKRGDRMSNDQVTGLDWRGISELSERMDCDAETERRNSPPIVSCPVEGRYEVSGMRLVAAAADLPCWYAGALMLVNWKLNQRRLSRLALIPEKLDAACRQLADVHGTSVHPDIRTQVDSLGLQAVPEGYPSPARLEQWLRLHGPLWVGSGGNVLVVGGIRDMQIKVYDPREEGKIYWRFIDEYGGYGARADEPAPVIMHCP